MKIGRVVFIMDEEKSEDLLNILDMTINGFYDDINKNDVQEIYNNLTEARKTVFVDDIKPVVFDTLPD